MYGEHRGWGGGVRIGSLLWGLFFIVLGAWWLAGELGYTNFTWRVAAPLGLIFIGLSVLIGRVWARRYWAHCGPPPREGGPQ